MQFRTLSGLRITGLYERASIASVAEGFCANIHVLYGIVQDPESVNYYQVRLRKTKIACANCCHSDG
jgi:hypothetical protein